MKIKFYKRATGAWCIVYNIKKEDKYGLYVKYLRNERAYKNVFYPMKRVDEVEDALAALRGWYGGFVHLDGVYTDQR